MYLRKPNNNANARLLTLPDAADYTGMGRNSARKFFDEIGAVRHFGKRVLIDRSVVDKHLDEMTAAAAEK